MWRTTFISLAAFVMASTMAAPSRALDTSSAGNPFVEGQLGDLRFEIGDGLRGIVPGGTVFTPAFRDLQISPAGGPERLLYFTPSMTIGDAVVSFAAGYGSNAMLPAGDATTMRIGGGVDFGGLRFGANLEQNSGAFVGDLGVRQLGFDLGAAYDIGPFTTGVTWSRGIYRAFFASSSSDATQDELSLSLSYRLGRGIDLIGALQYDQTDSKTRPEGAGSFIFGTAIRF